MDGGRLRRQLEARAARLPRPAAGIRYAIAAREAVDEPGDALAVTAADIFG